MSNKEEKTEKPNPIRCMKKNEFKKRNKTRPKKAAYSVLLCTSIKLEGNDFRHSSIKRPENYVDRTLSR